MAENETGWKNWTRLWASIGMVLWLAFCGGLILLRKIDLTPDWLKAIGAVFLLLLVATGGKSVLSELLATLKSVWGKK